jgi:hypothetical protein
MKAGLGLCLGLALGGAAVAQSAPPAMPSLQDLLRIADGLVEEARKADTGPQRSAESARLLAEAIARRERVAARLREAEADTRATPR